MLKSSLRFYRKDCSQLKIVKVKAGCILVILLGRDPVQLYRSLGLLDEAIMELIERTGDHAHANEVQCLLYRDSG